MGRYIKCICQKCKKIFFKWPSAIKQDRGKYCSRKCYYPYQKQMLDSLHNFMKGKKHTTEHKRKISFAHRGIKNPNWKGGKSIDKDGYVLIRRNDHPFKNYWGYVLEHRLVMEKHLNRFLQPKEVVHHINGDKKNNRIENLMLFSSHKIHLKYHWKNKI